MNAAKTQLISREKWMVTLVFWLAFSGTCLAHPPYVAPWMHAANLSLSGILGIVAGLILRRKTGILAAVLIGIAVSLLCSFGGLVLSMALSL